MRNIVIVGAGFAGLAAARAIEEGANVTVVDRAPDFEFLPNIHEIVSGQKTAKTLRLPRRNIIADLGHRLVAGAVTAIDLGARVVRTADEELPYDALVLAAGAEPTTSDVPGAALHAIPFRSAADAERIHERLQAISRGRAQEWITIVGGGFTGVEVLGEILREHRKDPRFRIRLLEGGARLMAGWPKSLHKRIEKLALRNGVEVSLGVRVDAVGIDHVRVGGAELPSALTIWTGGQQGPQFIADAGLMAIGKPWIDVEETLQARGHREVFVAGDLAGHPDQPAKQASHALAMGRRAGKNAARLLRGKSPKEVEIRDLPLLLTFGDLATFQIIEDKGVLESPTLAAARELIFQQTMATLDRRSAKGSRGRRSRRVDAAFETEALHDTFSVRGFLTGLSRSRVLSGF